MAYFQTKKVKTIPLPVPSEPGYVPPAPPTPPAAEDGEAPEIIRPGLTSNSIITLYQVFDEPIKVDKTLSSNSISLSGAFVEDVDILNPVVKIEAPAGANILDYNYAYIDTTARYYYVSAILLPESHVRLIMNVDPLKTWSNGLKMCTGICVKTDDNQYINNDLDDGSFVNEEGVAISIKNFSNSFLDSPVNILITAGG